jgi:hypothetical protein
VHAGGLPEVHDALTRRALQAMEPPRHVIQQRVPRHEDGAAGPGVPEATVKAAQMRSTEGAPHCCCGEPQSAGEALEPCHRATPVTEGQEL